MPTYDEDEWSDELQTKNLKDTTYQQQNLINNLSKDTSAEGKRALNVIKPQFEKNLNLYDKALKKYKKK